MVVTWNTNFIISFTWSMPSSVKSTEMPKKPKPLGEDLLPATKLFDHPRSLSADNKLPGPSWPIKWLM